MPVTILVLEREVVSRVTGKAIATLTATQAFPPGSSYLALPRLDGYVTARDAVRRMGCGAGARAIATRSHVGALVHRIRVRVEGVEKLVWVAPSEWRGGAPYHCEWHPAMRQTLALVDAALLREDRRGAPRCETAYHGTHTAVLPSIGREGLRASCDDGRGMPPMMGPGVYVGPYLKAMRFAMFPATFSDKRTVAEHVRGDGAVLRLLLDWTGGARVKTLDVGGRGEARCRCSVCARDTTDKPLFVDHDGLWHTRDRFEGVRVPPLQWAPGKWLSRREEVCVADRRRVIALDAARADLRTRGAHYDPRDERHRVHMGTLQRLT